MSQFCTSCGAQIEDEAKFCPICGAKVFEQEQVIPTVEPTIQYQEVEEEKPKKAKKKKGKVILIIFLVLFFIGGAATGVYLYLDRDGDVTKSVKEKALGTVGASSISSFAESYMEDAFVDILTEEGIEGTKVSVEILEQKELEGEDLEEYKKENQVPTEGYLFTVKINLSGEEEYSVTEEIPLVKVNGEWSLPVLNSFL